MYIVTGGAGFIGSALVRRLNELGIADILVVDNLACTEKWKNLVKADYLAYMQRDDFLRHLQEDSLEEALATQFSAHRTSAAALSDQSDTDVYELWSLSARAKQGSSGASGKPGTSGASGASAAARPGRGGDAENAYDLLARDVNLNIQGIVHLGACSSTTERDADYLMRNNLEYSKILCDYALRHGIRFIQASSAATYGEGMRPVQTSSDVACDTGDHCAQPCSSAPCGECVPLFDDDPTRLRELRPLNMYGYSKHLFDLWAADTGRLGSIASVKFFNVYGPNEYHKGDMRSMVHKAVEQIKATGKVRLFKSHRGDYADGGQLRDFIYVKDCAAVLAALLGQPGINGVFNLGTGKARSWNDLAQAVFKAMDREPKIEYIDLPEELRGKYQYYTKAEMGRLDAAFTHAGLRINLHSLEQGVDDYVREYLLQDDQYL